MLKLILSLYVDGAVIAACLLLAGVCVLGSGILAKKRPPTRLTNTMHFCFGIVISHV